MIEKTISIVNCAMADPEWQWIKPLHGKFDAMKWKFFSTRKKGFLEEKIKFFHLGRYRAAYQAKKYISSNKIDYLVTHGPWESSSSASIIGKISPKAEHIAMSFNFTDIPTGWRRNLMKRSFRKVDKFVVFSKIEAELYSKTFDIPLEKFSFIHWGVAPPIANPGARTIEKPYFVALGSEARDYHTLCEAARLMPDTQFVLIARAHNLEGLSIPENIQVHISIPFEDAWTLVWHAEASIIPLRSDYTPNGHVTLVGGMHIGKCQIITNSAGIRDYAEHEKTALLVAPHDADALCDAIRRLQKEPSLAREIGANAKRFATEHCSESATVDYFLKIFAPNDVTSELAPALS